MEQIQPEMYTFTAEESPPALYSLIASTSAVHEAVIASKSILSISPQVLLKQANSTVLCASITSYYQWTPTKVCNSFNEISTN
jgi:hypothetical protein